MKNTLIVLGVFLITACATPVTVKQAITKQSDAYGEFQTALQEFTKNYVNLSNQLFLLNKEAHDRMEALAIVYGLCGVDAARLPDKTWAKENYKQVREMAEHIDRTAPSQSKILDIYDKSAGYLEKSLQHSKKESAKDVEEIRKTLSDVESSQRNLSKEVNALMVIHDTVGEYLQIDLTPNAGILKEAITNIKAIKK